MITFIFGLAIGLVPFAATALQLPLAQLEIAGLHQGEAAPAETTVGADHSASGSPELKMSAAKHELVIQPHAPSCTLLRQRALYLEKQIEEVLKVVRNPEELEALSRRWVPIRESLNANWSKSVVQFAIDGLSPADLEKVRNRQYAVSFDIVGRLWEDSDGNLPEGISLRLEGNLLIVEVDWFGLSLCESEGGIFVRLNLRQ